jgi:hypothetical protein
MTSQVNRFRIASILTLSIPIVCAALPPDGSKDKAANPRLDPTRLPDTVPFERYTTTTGSGE